jgi:hypothetical protein
MLDNFVNFVNAALGRFFNIIEIYKQVALLKFPHAQLYLLGTLIKIAFPSGSRYTFLYPITAFLDMFDCIS